MLIKDFLKTWEFEIDYLDFTALKYRFEALRGLSNVRPDLTSEEVKKYAENVITVNRAQYEALAEINPYKSYFEEVEGTDKEKTEGQSTSTTTDTQIKQNELTRGISDTREMTYGRTEDDTRTPTGTIRNDTTSYAYNATSTSQPDSRTEESYQSYKETNSLKSGGTDTETVSHTGTDVQTEQVIDGDLKTIGTTENNNDGQHHEIRSGYVLRDIIDIIPQWTMIYDRIVEDIFSVIGVLIATRRIDYSLDW